MDRKSYSGKEKVAAVKEILQAGDFAGVARIHGLSPDRVRRWTQQAIDALPSVFGKKRGPRPPSALELAEKRNEEQAKRIVELEELLKVAREDLDGFTKREDELKQQEARLRAALRIGDGNPEVGLLMIKLEQAERARDGAYMALEELRQIAMKFQLTLLLFFKVYPRP